ncbi:MAG: hypothetical protein HY700_20830, partial [Gemmatimonadetes bacterium]|nr:hypothetical protein [Gemmatimonadota bacterium]
LLPYWPRILALLVFALALWAQTDALVGVFYDDGIYVVLAKSLAQGQGYRYLHLPGAPSGVHYPILYPAALGILWRIWPSFPANVALFQIFDSAALAVAAWVIAAQLRRLAVPALVQYVFVPAGFAAFPLLTIVGVRFSEPMFLALFAAAVSVADSDDAGLSRAVVAGVLAGLAALTRSIGVAVVAGVVVGYWLRGRRPQAIVVLAVAAIMVAPWFAWVAAHAHEVDPRLAANYGTYATAARQAGVMGFFAGLDLRALGPLGRLTVPGQTPWIRYPLSLLLLAVAVWGASLLSRRATALVVALAAYVAIVTVWPFTPDRFMWILVPWAAAFAGLGIVAAYERGRGFRVAAIVLSLVLVAGYLPREVLSLGRREFAATARDISQPDRLVAASIDAGLSADAVIAAEGEAMIYLYTGRTAVPNSLFRWKGRAIEYFPVDDVRRFFCETGVTHISLSGPASEGAPVVKALSEQADSIVRPIFRMTGGPALFRFVCRA